MPLNPLHFLLVGSLFTAEVRASPSYYLMVDAGSSGSRLQMIRVNGNVATLISPSAADDDKFETEPGLSSFADKPGAGAALAGIVKAAIPYIPADAVSSTKLYVRGTAGLRTLPVDKIEAIFKDVGSYLSKKENCPFKYVDGKVISGDNEAVFEYITMNSLLGYPDPPRGMLELGGASAQIAFKPEHDPLMFEQRFYMDNLRQSIFGTSYNGYGYQASRDRARTRLATASPKASTIQWPCYNKGYSETFKVGARSLKYVGTGDAKECKKLAFDVLNTDAECTLPPCGVKGMHQPPVPSKTRFTAVSAFYYIVQNLKLSVNEGKGVTPASILTKTTAWCALTYDEAVKKGMTWKYVKDLCYGGHLVYALLKTFGFADDDTRVDFAKKMGGGQIAWTLGAVLFEQQMPPKLPRVGDVKNTASSCLGFTCPSEMTLRPQPERLTCTGTGCTAQVCCLSIQEDARKSPNARKYSDVAVTPPQPTANSKATFSWAMLLMDVAGLLAFVSLVVRQRLFTRSTSDILETAEARTLTNTGIDYDLEGSLE